MSLGIQKFAPRCKKCLDKMSALQRSREGANAAVNIRAIGRKGDWVICICDTCKHKSKRRSQSAVRLWQISEASQ